MANFEDYDWVDDFQCHYARAHVKGKYLHVNRDATPGYEARFDYVGHFVSVVHNSTIVSRAVVRLGNEYFHIHRDGTPAYSERRDFAGDFNEDNVAYIEDAGKRFHINPDGTTAAY